MPTGKSEHWVPLIQLEELSKSVRIMQQQNVLKSICVEGELGLPRLQSWGTACYSSSKGITKKKKKEVVSVALQKKI